MQIESQVVDLMASCSFEDIIDMQESLSRIDLYKQSRNLEINVSWKEQPQQTFFVLNHCLLQFPEAINKDDLHDILYKLNQTILRRQDVESKILMIIEKSLQEIKPLYTFLNSRQKLVSITQEVTQNSLPQELIDIFATLKKSATKLLEIRAQLSKQPSFRYLYQYYIALSQLKVDQPSVELEQNCEPTKTIGIKELQYVQQVFISNKQRRVFRFDNLTGLNTYLTFIDLQIAMGDDPSTPMTVEELASILLREKKNDPQPDEDWSQTQICISGKYKID